MSAFLIAVALIIVLTTYDIWRRFRSPIPGIKKVRFSWPKPIQFLLFFFYEKKVQTTKLVCNYVEKYGDLFVLPLMGVDYVVMSGEDAVQWVSKHEREDNFARVFPSNLLILIGAENKDNEGLNSSRDIWKHTRTQLSAALMPTPVIDKFFPTMVEVVDGHLSQIKAIDNITLSEIIFEIGWLFIVGKRGYKYKKEVYQHYKDVRAAIMSMPLNLPGTKLRKGLEARAKIADALYKIVEDDPTARDDPDCSLHVILDPVGSRTIQPELRIIGLLFAAISTTMMTISGLLWHLIENPTILKKLKDEIRSHPEPKSLSDLQKFTYLNKCVREALRLYGVETVARQAKTTLQFKNYQFPPGTRFFIVTGYEHQNVANPKLFDPDREEKYRLEPFGTPVRNCIGKVFAQFQLRMFVYLILKNYDVVGEKDEGASIRQGFTVSLSNARLRLEQCVKTN